MRPIPRRMYSLNRILEGLKRPHSIGRELNRLLHRRFYTRQYNPRGVNFLDEDWDNLVILDACRYDTFKKHATLPGKLEYRYTLGSATNEFISANFKNRQLYDTAYISANTWYSKLQNDIQADIFYFANLQDGSHEVEWADERLGVVTPGSVTCHAMEAIEEFPNKRLIIHYLQPHHPFIGEFGREHFSYQSNSLFEVVNKADSKISEEDLEKAYLENFHIVLESIQDLLPKLFGKTVVTADHGEMLGDRHTYIPIRDYGHPAGIYNEVTTKVPWHIFDSSNRKVIESDEPIELNSDPQSIDQQLRNLGYKV